MHLWDLLKPFVLPVAGVVAALLHGWLVKSPSDQERAAHLAQMAHDAAAWVVAFFPALPEKDLIQKIVDTLAAAAGVPTTNPQALERAAAGALSAIRSAKPGA
jgi:hypothetical protein